MSDKADAALAAWDAAYHHEDGALLRLVTDMTPVAREEFLLAAYRALECAKAVKRWSRAAAAKEVTEP